MIDITPDMGGEIKETIESLNGKSFSCPHCGTMNQCDRWKGYENTEGVPDKNGVKYWMIIECHDCHRDVSLWKIKAKLS